MGPVLLNNLLTFLKHLRDCWFCTVWTSNVWCSYCTVLRQKRT
jgi:hypothetical protein